MAAFETNLFSLPRIFLTDGFSFRLSVYSYAARITYCTTVCWQKNGDDLVQYCSIGFCNRLCIVDPDSTVIMMAFIIVCVSVVQYCCFVVLLMLLCRRQGKWTDIVSVDYRNTVLVATMLYVDYPTVQYCRMRDFHNGIRDSFHPGSLLFRLPLFSC